MGYGIMGFLLVVLLVAGCILFYCYFLKRRKKDKKKKKAKKGKSSEGSTGTEGAEGGEGDDDDEEGETEIYVIAPKKRRSRGGKKKGGKKGKKMPDGVKEAFRIPSKDIKFKGALRMKKRFHGDATHDLEGVETPNNKVKEVVFDPALNEAHAIGEGVEEVQKSQTDASFSDTDRSEFLRSGKRSTKDKRGRHEAPKSARFVPGSSE